MSRILFKSASTAEQPVQVHGSERFRLLSEVHLHLTAAGAAHSAEILPTVADLNACLRLPSDVARLVARLAGQLESIVWVDGPNRAWLAGILTEALQLDTPAARAVLRAEAGWPAAQQLLLQSDAEPVFIYCTAGEYFPYMEGWAGSAEQWDELSEAEQWAHHEGILRGESEREDATAGPSLVAAPFSRELRPSNWLQFFFAEETN